MHNRERALSGLPPTSYADYRTGGYVVTQPMRRPAHIAADVFPDVLASPATCDNDVTLDTLWSISPRLWAQYGVPPERMPTLRAWIDAHYERDFGYPNVFFSLAAARQFIADFFPSSHAWIILGLGLHHTLVDAFLASEAAYPPETHQSARGICTLLARDETLPAGGTPLGHDLLGCEYGYLHTWLCIWVYGAFVEEGRQALGLALNPWGKFDTFAAAQQYAAHANSYGTEGVDLWLPWLIVQYGP